MAWIVKVNPANVHGRWFVTPSLQFSFIEPDTIVQPKNTLDVETKFEQQLGSQPLGLGWVVNTYKVHEKHPLYLPSLGAIVYELGEAMSCRWMFGKKELRSSGPLRTPKTQTELLDLIGAIEIPPVSTKLELVFTFKTSPEKRQQISIEVSDRKPTNFPPVLFPDQTVVYDLADEFLAKLFAQTNGIQKDSQSMPDLLEPFNPKLREGLKQFWALKSKMFPKAKNELMSIFFKNIKQENVFVTNLFVGYLWSKNPASFSESNVLRLRPTTLPTKTIDPFLAHKASPSFLRVIANTLGSDDLTFGSLQPTQAFLDQYIFPEGWIKAEKSVKKWMERSAYADYSFSIRTILDVCVYGKIPDAPVAKRFVSQYSPVEADKLVVGLYARPDRLAPWFGKQPYFVETVITPKQIFHLNPLEKTPFEAIANCLAALFVGKMFNTGHPVSAKCFNLVRSLLNDNISDDKFGGMFLKVLQGQRTVPILSEALERRYKDYSMSQLLAALHDTIQLNVLHIEISSAAITENSLLFDPMPYTFLYEYNQPTWVFLQIGDMVYECHRTYNEPAVNTHLDWSTPHFDAANYRVNQSSFVDFLDEIKWGTGVKQWTVRERTETMVSDLVPSLWDTNDVAITSGVWQFVLNDVPAIGDIPVIKFDTEGPFPEFAWTQTKDTKLSKFLPLVVYYEKHQWLDVIKAKMFIKNGKSVDAISCQFSLVFITDCDMFENDQRTAGTGGNNDPDESPPTAKTSFFGQMANMLAFAASKAGNAVTTIAKAATAAASSDTEEEEEQEKEPTPPASQPNTPPRAPSPVPPPPPVIPPQGPVLHVFFPSTPVGNIQTPCLHTVKTMDLVKLSYYPKSEPDSLATTSMLAARPTSFPNKSGLVAFYQLKLDVKSASVQTISAV